MTTDQKPRDEATALREYGLAVGRAVRDAAYEEWAVPEYQRRDAIDLTAIVASVEPPEQRYPPIANDQDKRLMLETLEFALRVPGGPEKLYATLCEDLGLVQEP